MDEIVQHLILIEQAAGVAVVLLFVIALIVGVIALRQ